MIVPDMSQDIIYAWSKESITAHRLDAALTELGQRRVELPDEQQADFSRVYHTIYRHRDYRLDHPIAWTEGESLRLFAMDLKSGVVLAAETRAFAPRRSVDVPHEALAGEPAAPANPAPAGAEEGLLTDFPTLTIAGRRLEHSFPDAGGVTYELISGPDGMTLTRAGELAWTPGAGDAGSHSLQIRVVRDGEPFLEEPTLVVVEKSLADAVHGDLTQLQPTALPLELETPILFPLYERGILLLLQGDQLRLIQPDGITAGEPATLPNRYTRFDIRGDLFLGIVEGEHVLEVVDLDSQQVRKRIDLTASGRRILEITDLAVHPDRPYSYVAIKHDIDVPRFLVLVVNDRTGDISDEPLLGTWVEIDRNGSNLYCGYRDIYQTGTRFHLNPNWSLLATPEYGNIDMLVRYDVGVGSPEMDQILDEAGGNGSGIRLSPDGRRVVYLSHVGFPLHSNNVPGFNAHDLDQPPVSYSADVAPAPQDLAFHPSLEVVAVPTEGGAALFQQESGRRIENPLLLLEGGLGDVTVERLVFAPDGHALIFQCTGGPTGRQLLRVPLRPGLVARERTGGFDDTGPGIVDAAPPPEGPLEGPLDDGVMPPAEPDVVLTAVEFESAFWDRPEGSEQSIESLQEAARQKFADKTIQVTGTVIGYLSEGGLELNGNPDPDNRSIFIGGVRCLTGDDAPWLSVGIGQTVTLQGRLSESGLVVDELSECLITDVTGEQDCPQWTAAELVSLIDADVTAFNRKYGNTTARVTGTVSELERYGNNDDLRVWIGDEESGRVGLNFEHGTAADGERLSPGDDVEAYVWLRPGPDRDAAFSLDSPLAFTVYLVSPLRLESLPVWDNYVDSVPLFTADEFVEFYRTNPREFAESFNESQIRIAGKVLRVESNDVVSMVYLQNSMDHQLRAQFQLDRRAAALKQGDSVTVQGEYWTLAPRQATLQDSITLSDARLIADQ